MLKKRRTFVRLILPLILASIGCTQKTGLSGLVNSGASNSSSGSPSSSPSPTPLPTSKPTATPTSTPPPGPTATTTPVTTPPPNAPAAPINVVGLGDVKGIDVFFKGPSNSSSNPLTKYTATAYNYPGGSPTGVSASTLVQATTGALSNYVRLNGLTGGAQYTVVVTATNASGTSAPSTPSSPIVTKPLSAYFIQNGNGRPGLPGNTGWSTWTGSGTFDYASTAVKYQNEANSIMMSSGSLILPFYLNVWNNYPANGAFNTSPYTSCILKVYGSGFDGGPISVSFRWAKFVFGYVWQGSTNSITDNSQLFLNNGLTNGAASMQPFGGNTAYNAGTLNVLGSMISGIGGGFNWGGISQYIWSQGDVDFNNGSTNPAPGGNGIVQYVTSPNPGQFTPNQWNTVEIPLSATNIASGIPAAQANGWIPGSIQEIRVFNGNGSTIYITDLGFQ